jgi:hypothetical protein
MGNDKIKSHLDRIFLTICLVGLNRLLKNPAACHSRESGSPGPIEKTGLLLAQE